MGSSLPTSPILALLVAFAIGIATFIGPCAPARLTSMHADSRQRVATLVYILATGVGFATLGALGALLFRMIFLISPLMYAALGLVAIVTGLRELWPSADKHDHRHGATTVIGAAMSGFASAWTLAPCCTPIIVGAITIAPTTAWTAAILGAYGIGHALPFLALQKLMSRFNTPTMQATLSLVIGGLGVGLGAYYLILA